MKYIIIKTHNEESSVVASLNTEEEVRNFYRELDADEIRKAKETAEKKRRKMISELLTIGKYFNPNITEEDLPRIYKEERDGDRESRGSLYYSLFEQLGELYRNPNHFTRGEVLSYRWWYEPVFYYSHKRDEYDRASIDSQYSSETVTEFLQTEFPVNEYTRYRAYYREQAGRTHGHWGDEYKLFIIED